MRPGPVVLLSVGLAAALVPTAWIAPAVADCAAPRLSVVDGATLSPGERVEMSGSGFQDGCADVGSTDAFGCTRFEEVDPARDVVLRVEQGGRSWELGSADADGSYRASWRVVLPDELAPGRARLVADGSEPLRVRVVVPSR